MKLLIKWPTRGRPDKFFEVLAKYRAMLSGRHDVRFLVTCDEDDSTMNSPDVRQRLAEIPGVQFSFGRHNGKVAAINANMDVDFDVLLLASDDMIPQVHGYDDVIMSRMKKYFPDLDGVLWFNDGFVGRRLNTLTIMGRQYYQRTLYIYQPDYVSLWADNEFTEVADLLGRQVYFEDVIIRHEHPGNVGSRTDGVYVRAEAHNDRDKKLYTLRKAAGFGIGAKDMHENGGTVTGDGDITKPTVHTRGGLGREITQVSMSITTHCNMSCPECAYGTPRVDDKQHFSWEYFEEAAKHLRGIKSLGITGGEPTCHPEFSKFVPRFRELFDCVELYLETNGCLVEKHSDVLEFFDRVGITHYGESVYPGCPDNTAQMEFLRARLKGTRVTLNTWDA
ncbi:hypothetical protein LCGC14_1250640, partial [marine sediment metagenome]